MNSRNKDNKQVYFLFAILLCCSFLYACKTKTASTLESESNKVSPLQLTSQLENEDLNSLEPQISKDANGNEMAIWEEFDGTRFGIWAKRRVATLNKDGTVVETWERSIPIDAMNIGNAYHPQVQFDLLGNATAVWEQSNGLKSTIWTNSYTAGKGWGTAYQIETLSDGNAQKPQIAMTSNSRALVVWKQSTAQNLTQFQIYASQKNSSLAWSKPTLIDTELGNSNSPTIASDANGNALAIWHTFDGVQNKIKANYFTALGGWSKASSVEASYSDAYDPSITLDAKGNAIAVWHQMDGSSPNFWANRFVPQAGWGKAKLVKPDLNDGNAPIVSLDHFGNAVLASQKLPQFLVNINN